MLIGYGVGCIVTFVGCMLVTYYIDKSLSVQELALTLALTLTSWVGAMVLLSAYLVSKSEIILWKRGGKDER